MYRLVRGVVVTTLAVAAVTTRGAEAQGAGFAWDNTTEISFVSTGGNASSSTLGLKAALTGTKAPNAFKIELGAIRGETSTSTRTATGTATSFDVVKTTNSALTAESYFVRGRYDRTFSSVYVFSGSGWDRNTFAGVQNRYALVAGLGRNWVEGDAGRFKTDVGATYTIQKDVDPAEGADEAFGGVRLSIDALRPLSESTVFESVLIIDQNLKDTGDARGDWSNSLALSLSSSLAFKTSFQLLYDREPALLRVPLFDTNGVTTGTDVLTPGDKVDSVLTLTLVITL